MAAALSAPEKERSELWAGGEESGNAVVLLLQMVADFLVSV